MQDMNKGGLYLMDNISVVAGTRSMAYLQENIFNNPVGATYYRAISDQIEQSIENALWIPATADKAGMYQPSITTTSPKWACYYPDAMAQLASITGGVADPQRSMALYREFNHHYPNWDTMTIPKETFPQALIAHAASIVGDIQRVDTYLAYAQDRFAAHQYPWNVGESGSAIRAANIRLRQMISTPQ